MLLINKTRFVSCFVYRRLSRDRFRSRLDCHIILFNLQVIVPKVKGEQLGVVIVESGWGSMVPTVVLANMSPTGPAARCGQLNIGDQIISVNGISLVGLPLSSCQTSIKVRVVALIKIIIIIIIILKVIIMIIIVIIIIVIMIIIFHFNAELFKDV